MNTADQQHDHTDANVPDASASQPQGQHPLDQVNGLVDALGWQGLLLTLCIAAHQRQTREDALAAGILESAAEFIGRHAKDHDGKPGDQDEKAGEGSE